MSKEIPVAAFEGGKLRVMSSGDSGHEAVLALPLSRLLVRMVRVPAGTDAQDAVSAALKAASPYPDEPLAVSFEAVSEDASGTTVLAAALPESAAEDIAEALDAAKLNVVRVDALALGCLRGLWSQLAGEGRRLVLFESVDGISLFVLDGDRPSAVRALSAGADLRRETTLSLLEAEDFGGAMPLAEIVLVHTRPDGEPPEAAPEEGESEGGEPPSPPPVTLETVRAEIGAFAEGNVRELTIGPDAGLVGVASRNDDAAPLDVLPDSWREFLNETRFKAKLLRNMTLAIGLWVLAMGVLFGVPFGYGYLTDRVKDRCKQHGSQYRLVSDMKSKVGIIEKYSDHSRGALELMKAISDRLPEGVTLVSWDFKRADGIRLRGESAGTAPVYQFNDALRDMKTAGEDGEAVFTEVALGSLNAQKDGLQKFELTCALQEVEE